MLRFSPAVIVPAKVDWPSEVTVTAVSLVTSIINDKSLGRLAHGLVAFDGLPVMTGAASVGTSGAHRLEGAGGGIGAAGADAAAAFNSAWRA
jgi:hypothetical protein